MLYLALGHSEGHFSPVYNIFQTKQAIENRIDVENEHTHQEQYQAEHTVIVQ